jgi:hypothetical protein
VNAADSLDIKLRVVVRKLFQTRATGRGQDVLRWPQRIAEQLEYLAGEAEGVITRRRNRSGRLPTC